MLKYVLRENIYIDPGNDQPFHYSDGDEAENYILDILTRATDLSLGSEELFTAIRDWPSLYHLNPQRADLLRPIADRLKEKSLLEIGSGAGAITRYLGELNCQVTALEGSWRRAQMTRQRCRDLSNVNVICDNFQGFPIQEKFDAITLIGVLEYSNLFIQADHPTEAMLQKVRSLLNPGGFLIIAIENKLGLKYLAGAPEDHLGKPYYGIEDKYCRTSSATFGKAELKILLQNAGFEQLDFWYPFPDYKLPRVILTDKGIHEDSFLVEELLNEKFEYFQGQPYINHFSIGLAMKVFHKNRLMADFSNSFLILANPVENKTIPPERTLAYAYSTSRRKRFCKENIFQVDDQDRITVIKKNIYPAYLAGNDLRDDDKGHIRQKVENELYHRGQLLWTEAIAVTSRNGWSVEELGTWAKTYHNILCKFAIVSDEGLLLEGKYADLTPFNILIKDDREFEIFDQEWLIDGNVPLYYVFFRGVRYSMGNILFCHPPVEGTPLNILDLTLGIINNVFPFSRQMMDTCLEMENRYFSAIMFARLHSFDGGDIQVRGVYPFEKKIFLQQRQIASFDLERDRLNLAIENLVRERLELNKDLVRMSEKADDTRKKLENERERALILQQDKDWYIRTYEKRSLLGIAGSRLAHLLRKKAGK